MANPFYQPITIPKPVNFTTALSQPVTTVTQPNTGVQPTYNPVTQRWSVGPSSVQPSNGPLINMGYDPYTGSYYQEYAPVDRTGSPLNPTANLPTGNLDIMNPGPYLADLLRNQLPGYVMGTRVPRPNQITLQSWVGMNPTMRSVLAAYWSSLGIPPEDAMQEMVKSWLSPGPTNTARYLA